MQHQSQMGEPVTALPPPPGPGWYPDPSGAPAQRYFDGTKWTEQLAPLSTPTVGHPQVQGPLPPPKSAAAAGLLQLFFGTFGVGRFYIGDTGTAAAQLVLGLVGLFLMWFCFIGLWILIPLWIWTFIDAIMMGQAHGRGVRVRSLA
jgi:TM2 domain-containing membrane protein YozV